MFARVLNITLAICILCCPIMCSLGLSCCGAHGASGHAAIADCEHDDASPCCCCESGSEKEPIHAPKPCKTCRGICGGALLQEPCELADVPAWELLTTPQLTDLSFSTRTTEACAPDRFMMREVHNRGRATRVLLGSLLV